MSHIQHTSILTAAQMRTVDSATICEEPIASIDLMERAATACVDWLMTHQPDNTHYSVWCGLGNNGGDGLAIARLLLERGRQVHAYLVDYGTPMSADAQINLHRLQAIAPTQIRAIRSMNDLPQRLKNSEHTDTPHSHIDALLGTGTTRAADGLLAHVIETLNRTLSSDTVHTVAIDMPSGLLSDTHTPANWPVIHATHTLTFECAKTALLWPENAERVGAWQILPIGLNHTAIAAANSPMQLVTTEWVQAQRKPRDKFSHKGTFGHALLIAGAHGTVGAAILASRACLRSGSGLLTIHSPQCAYLPLQTTIPEAMVQTDTHERLWSDTIEIKKYDALGIGCGIGQAPETRTALRTLLQTIHACSDVPRLILDADALNIIASEPDLFAFLPPKTILTPHPKEFERLVAHLSLDTKTDEQRHQAQLRLAQRYNLIVVLKGAHTCTALPDGRSYYNTTGNPGMAKGGSGDALTGVILAQLAQGYTPDVAAILGVYMHGAAGDAAAQKHGQRAMLPSDLIECLGHVNL